MTRIIGSNIKEARKLAGLTQPELGERIARDAPAVSLYESGTREVSSTLLYRIARACRVPVAELFRGCGRAEDA